MPDDAGLKELDGSQIDNGAFDFDEPNPAEEVGDVVDSAKADDPGLAEQTTTTEFDDAGDDTSTGGEDTGEQAEEWDATLLQMAGLSADDAAKHFKSQTELEAAMNWQDSQALQAGRAALQQQQLYAQWQQQQMAQAQRPTVAYQGQQTKPPEEFKLDLDPEEWGEETVGLLQKMHSFYTGKISAAEERARKLEMAFGGMHQTMLQQQQDAYLEAFDSRVNGLPQEYKETFGIGNRATLPPNGKEFQNRLRLNQAMQAIAHGRQVSGLSPLNHDQLFDRALKAEFSKISEQAVRRQVGEQVTKRLGQTTNRPSNRKATNLSPEAKAAQRVASFAKKHGILVADHEDLSDGV